MHQPIRAQQAESLISGLHAYLHVTSAQSNATAEFYNTTMVMATFLIAQGLIALTWFKRVNDAVTEPYLVGYSDPSGKEPSLIVS
jgi:hypothetical protein